MDFHKVLVISPHTDDGELAAGGTIARFIEEGIEVHLAVMCGNYKNLGSKLLSNEILRNECQRSAATLGITNSQITYFDYELRYFPAFRQEILDNMIELKQKIKPELVLVPSSNDMHQDHHTIHQEALRAFKKDSSIWGYEHPWNNLSFTTDILVRLDEKQVQMKIEALKCYKSQVDKSYFDERYIWSLAYTRGTQVDWPYAEAFELVRMLL
jgi:LmbE family N-acetylglucosaminyl deacetylase